PGRGGGTREGGAGGGSGVGGGGGSGKGRRQAERGDRGLEDGVHGVPVVNAGGLPLRTQLHDRVMTARCRCDDGCMTVSRNPGRVTRPALHPSCHFPVIKPPHRVHAGAALHGRPSAYGRSAACLSVACIHPSTSPSGTHHMRHTILAAALATALGSTSFTAAAQSAQDREISELKAQIMALAAKVEELETRTDAQSDINVATQENLDKMATSTPAVSTKGGIKITSPDKQFEASIGGRIHFDAYAFDRDLADTTGTSEFRRARLTLQGKAYGWDYKMENDFGAGGGLEGFRDVYIAKSALGGKFTIGHFKPYRSMEELTSSNEILMMERPFASATGLFNGRQFQQGVGYRRSGDNYTAGFSVFNLRGATGPRNEGMGYSGRVTFAPINTSDSTLHFGGWVSHENANQG